MQNREPTGVTALLIILSDSITLAHPIIRPSRSLVVVDELIGDPHYGDQNTIDRLDRKFLSSGGHAARFMLIQAAVLGEYTSNHCVLREAWEARLTRQ